MVAGIGINADAGIDRTLGAVLGLDTGETVKLPVPGQGGGQEGAVPLWQSWKPPAGMPAAGEQGTHDIPNSHSGFIARPAGIYLPPAARTAKPPILPLVIMLMGQPGDPTPQFIGGVLDTYAAANQGLAPIVVVADQIGPDQNDTLCVDSKKYGKVESYIMKDVVGFARDNLGVLQDPKSWTIAGYSNGGQCAISLGAKYPDVFGNILDISGEEFPGAEDSSGNLAQVFNGDQAAYDAQKPINIMAGKHFRDTTAIFTVGALDAIYVPAAQTVSAAAQAAGMATTYYEVPNAGHLGAALTGGLEKGFEILYPRLDLSR
ncbi:esterase family protein [Arthrobacter sp. PAMC 25486]|uniref:alpha/beta hydrolase n=1 Tax=Arthrobacter sp. PAMC 25486 TaxID=1494608 RepID=UPI0020A65CCB|nr:alpha/beta hydrolase-fold protein [Arthrobacter sp. PAMC 25486]